jgi:hypothetical protein
MSPHLATREAEVDMKHLLSTRRFQLLAAVSLALVILPQSKQSRAARETPLV